MEKNETPDGDCEQVSTTVAYLLLANNLWIDKNGNVTNKTEEGVYPFVPLIIGMKADDGTGNIVGHVGNAYLAQNETTGGVDVVLSNYDWWLFKSGDWSRYTIMPAGSIWYEIEGPIDIAGIPPYATQHMLFGGGVVNVRVSYNNTQWPGTTFFSGEPLYNVSGLNASEIHQRVPYEKILNYTEKVQEGDIKFSFADDLLVSYGPFRRWRYDLLYRDYPIGIPEFSNVILPTISTLLIGLYARRQLERKRRKNQ